MKTRACMRMFERKWASPYFWAVFVSNYKKNTCIAVAFVVLILPLFFEKHIRETPCTLPAISNSLDNLYLDLSAVDAGVEKYLVPNNVHFYRFGDAAKTLNLVDVLCMLAAYRQQKPDLLFIHTDDVDATSHSFSNYSFGKKLLSEPNFVDRLRIVLYPQPKYVFGMPFSVKYKEWHMSDLARLRILRRYGGIFLDNDVYLLNNVNELRKNELTIMNFVDGEIENNLIAAHRDSRFLYVWIKSYMKYSPDDEGHHKTKKFINMINKEPVQPSVVKKGIELSNVQKFFEDDVHEKGCYAVVLNIKPRGKTSQLEYLKYIETYGPEFIERYFNLNEDTRKRVNDVDRYLFDNLSA